MRVALVVILLIACACRTSEGPTPTPTPSCLSIQGKADRDCTPGALNPDVTQATIATTICAPRWTDRIRPPTSYTTPLKRKQLNLYAYLPADPEPIDLADYREDHLIALSLGGAASDPRNLWPQPVGPDVIKNNDAAQLKMRVCIGTLTLAEAQAELLSRWLSP